MDAKTLRQKNTRALFHDLAEAKKHLQGLSFKSSTEQIKQVRELRMLKKTIARVQTILHELKKT